MKNSSKRLSVQGHPRRVIFTMEFCRYEDFNIEVPLIDKEEPIPKCGPNLVTHIITINGIKALNPSLIALANNHILDQGE